MNRRKFLFSSAIGLFVPSLFGMPPSQRWRMVQQPKPKQASTPIFNWSENFDDPGYENTWASGAGAGTATDDDNTFVINGTNNLKLDASTASVVRYSNITSQTELYFFCAFKADTIAPVNSKYVVRIYDGSAYPFQIIHVAATGKLRVYHGSSFKTTVGALYSGANYIWAHWKNLTATTGTYELGFSNDISSKPVSGDYYTSDINGTNTNAVNSIYLNAAFNSGDGVVSYYDGIRLSTAVIGASPL